MEVHTSIIAIFYLVTLGGMGGRVTSHAQGFPFLLKRHLYVPRGLIWEIDGEKIGFDYGEMKIRPKSWACGNKSPYPDDVLRRAFLAANYPHLNPFKESENTED